MTTPDPVRASFEAWYRDHPPLPHSTDYTSTRQAFLAGAAYRAASKVSELEREYLEACYAHEAIRTGSMTDYDNGAYLTSLEVRLAKYNALRAHRCPKVDRVQAALETVGKLIERPGVYESLRLAEIRDLLTEELRERDGGKP